MNKEEQKYLIALGNLQSMAIDNTKGSKAVEICINGIRTYVDRLNNIINQLEKWLEEVIDSNLKDYSFEELYRKGKCVAYKMALAKLKELKENDK